MTSNMKRYEEWSPTTFDRAGAFLDDDRKDWFVIPVMQTRDSGCLDRSNFETVERVLEELDPDSETWEAHRFNHWGPGWYEIIIVKPESKASDFADETERSLEDHPVLDEDDFYQKETDEQNEIWNECYTLAEKIDVCREAGISIFAARRDYAPHADNGECLVQC